MSMIITNENDAYIFFEIIEKLAPSRVLDIGMALKRFGSVARGLMNRELPEQMVLDGVDFYPQVNFPIWGKIYHSITVYQEFLLERQGNYDLTIMLGIEELKENADMIDLLNIGKRVSQYMLVDSLPREWESLLLEQQIVELNVEQDLYFLIDFGV